MADNTFLNVALSAVDDRPRWTSPPGPIIAAGPDRVSTGQLMMISKGSLTTLVQVTAVNTDDAASDVRQRRLAEPESVWCRLRQPDGAQRSGTC